MSDAVTAAAEWAARPGPPNWVFSLAVLTSPAIWSNAARDRVAGALSAFGPGGGSDGESA